MPDPKSVKIEKHTADRLISNSRFIDKRARNEVKPDADPIDYGGGTVLVLTTSMTGGSASSPGFGMGRIQKFVDGAFRNATTATTAYKIWNIHSATVANGSFVLCLPAYGYFFFVTTDCGNIST